MRRRIATIFILSVAAVTMSGCAQSSDARKLAGESHALKIGTIGETYPNSYKENGELTGFDVEVAEIIAQRLGYDIGWVFADFGGLMGQLDSGRIDTIANSVVKTEERQKKFNFTSAYSYSASQFVTNERNDEIRSREDFDGKEVSVTLGTNDVANVRSYDSRGRIGIKTYETRDGALRDAIAGRVDGHVNTRSTMLADIKKNNYPLKLVGDPISCEEVAFPFLKKARGNELRQMFEEELKKLRDDGTLAQLSKKYFDEDVTLKASN